MILGLAGKKGVGKDTAGAYLVEKYGFTRVAFADALKESAAACFGMPVEWWDELKNDPYATVYIEATGTPPTEDDPFAGTTTVARVSAREFLQRYGTEAHRDIFGKDFWVEALAEKLDDYWNKNYVVTDARFDNECHHLRDWYGAIIVQIRRGGNVYQDAHSSERPVSPHLVDLVVDNNAGREAMYVQLDGLVERLGIEV